MLLESLLGKDADVLSQRNFQALLVTNLLAPLGVPLLSPILSSLTEPFGVSTARIGLLIAAYTAPPIVLIPIAGILADRYGRKPVMLTGVLLFGVGGMGIAFVTDFRLAIGLRLLQGVGFAGLTPIIITSIGDLYVDSREATAQGVRFMSSGVYQSVFPLSPEYSSGSLGNSRFLFTRSPSPSRSSSTSGSTSHSTSPGLRRTNDQRRKSGGRW